MASRRSFRTSAWPRRIWLSLALGLALGVAAAPSGAPGVGRDSAGGYSEWIATLHRTGLDFMFFGHEILGSPPPALSPLPLSSPARAPIALVVIDEETYRRSPFAGTPRVTWTPQIGRVIEALDRAGATVIGMDLIYPTSVDRPGLMPGHDKPFLKALYRAGRAGRLLLGELQVSAQPLRPHPGQVMAVGGDGNLAQLNLLVDRDDVVRGYPAHFEAIGGGVRPSLAVEVARRAGAKVPPGDFLIDFTDMRAAIDTFSFADIYACAMAGRADFLGAAFKDRIVLIGTALDIEDRRLAANRYMTSAGRVRSAERCVLARDETRFGEIVDRRTIPGIYIHAAAIATVLRERPLRMPSAMVNMLLVGGVSSASALLYFAIGPAIGVIAVLAILGLTALAAMMAFGAGIVAPAVTLALAILGSFTSVYAYRFAIEERGKRRVQSAFRYFLAPSLVDRLAEHTDDLRLGGETKRVVVWFSDIAGYTALSEGLRDDPQRLVALINRYFTVMSGVVERQGGYIDKFIGDAVMCVWGAPLDDPDADLHAVDAALEAVAVLETFNRDVIVGEFGLPETFTRIGINSGPAVAGNMGSETRFNYTVTGDTVNLAARFEGACKMYECPILVGEDTARGLARVILFRRLDRLVVKGTSRPAKVYQPLGHRARLGPEVVERARLFRRALALYDRRQFPAAAERFAVLAADDPAAALYVQRCQTFIGAPPGEDWDGSFTMVMK
jgi:adenylate cyclase